MQKFKMIRKGAQAGFTLIELIVVIVILGILAATALPRFVDMGADARVASLMAARGSLTATSAMAHGRFLTNTTGTPLTVLAVEGVNVNYATSVQSGYPMASADFANAAGLGADYTVVVNATNGIVAATATAPAVPAFGMTVVPNGIANTARAVTCFVSYAEPAALNTAPTFSAAPTAANC